MLWVSANPRCGKSVLARHLVDSIVQTTESRTVCYFFFKDGFPDQKSVSSALCCILRQIFIQKPSILSEAILKRFNSGGETFNESFSELWQTLMQVAEDKDAGEIVCLLEAIDECEDQSGQGGSQLLKALCTRRSALGVTAENGHKETLTLLLEVGADPDFQGPFSGKAVMIASMAAHEEIAKLLLEAGAGVNDQSGNGETASIHASENGHEVIAKLLFEAGVNQSIERTYEWMSLMSAAVHGHAEIVNILLDAGCIRQQGATLALRHAALKGHEAVVKMLPEAGVEPSEEILLDARQSWKKGWKHL
ncbi:ankyrin repeat-containing domain protein [Trichoderma barbatum]